MTSRDPLCCVHAFWVAVRIVLPALYGLRMCPDCPKCVTSATPSMDVFGSNGTPMGGSAGRADAMVGAVEAQKAEGVLHLHLFLFLHMFHQFHTLHEVAERLREGLLSAEAMKAFMSYVRCASYPDVERFRRERTTIEAAWPAYARDQSLSRPSRFLFASTNSGSHFAEAGTCEWKADGSA